MKKNIIKIFLLVSLVLLLNSCFGYKLVKVEEIEKTPSNSENIINNENIENNEEKNYEPGTVGYRLHQKKLQEEMQENENIENSGALEENTNSGTLEEEKKDEEEKENNNDFSFSKLADIKDFGEPIKKGQGVISSKNYNLYIFKDNSEILENIDRDNLKEFFTYHKDEDIEDLTKFISSRYNIFYRNTARTINKNKGFTFFVIHAQGDNYVYEKHYIDLENKLHGILFLDKGNLGEVKDIKEKLEKLKQKNTELKQITEFSEIPSANKIFSEIVNKEF